MVITVSALVFVALMGVVIIFQACLAAGVPWGAASMGGKYPGTYPPRMRVVAVANMLLLTFIACIVLAEANLALAPLKPLASVGIWFVVVFSGLGTVLNTITPSKIERIWAPVALVHLITSLLIAIR